MRLSLFGYFLSALVSMTSALVAFSATVVEITTRLLELAFPPTAAAARILSDIPSLATVAQPIQPSTAAVRSFESRRLARVPSFFGRTPAALAI